MFVLLSFFLKCSAHPRTLHSFPTRRSSDLVTDAAANSGTNSRRTSRRMAVSGGRGGGKKAGDCHAPTGSSARSEEHTSELQSQSNLVCRLLLEKKKKKKKKKKK